MILPRISICDSSKSMSEEPSSLSIMSWLLSAPSFCSSSLCGKRVPTSAAIATALDFMSPWSDFQRSGPRSSVWYGWFGGGTWTGAGAAGCWYAPPYCPGGANGLIGACVCVVIGSLSFLVLLESGEALGSPRLARLDSDRRGELTHG